MRAIIFLVAFVSALESAEVVAEPKQTLRLATTEWCPYVCSGDEQHPGIIHEYVAEVLHKNKIKLEVGSYPWSRSIALAKRGGVYHGLLSAVPSEAEGLLLTQVPISTYRICFYTSPENLWRYSGSASLQTLRGALGYFSDYGYGEPVEEFIKDPKTETNRMELSGKIDPTRLISLLEAGRIKAFVEDENIMGWQVAHDDLEKNSSVTAQKIIKAGCLSSRPFFLALNPKYDRVDELLEVLNAEFSKPENLALLEQITEKYVGKTLY